MLPSPPCPPFNLEFSVLRTKGWFTLETCTSRSAMSGPPGRQLCVLSQTPVLRVELPVCVGRFLACPSLFEAPCLSLCLYAHFFISSSASRQPPKKIWDYTPGDCSILPREDRKVILCLLLGLCARSLALGAVSVLWVCVLFLNLFVFKLSDLFGLVIILFNKACETYTNV